MTQAVVIIAPRDLSVQSLRSLFEGRGCRVFSGSKVTDIQVQDQAGTSFVDVSSMDRPEELRADYLENDLLDWEFRSSLDDEKIYLHVTFNEFEAARSVIEALLRTLGDDIKDCWVDTDYGWVIRGDHLLDNLRRSPDWDWRRRPS